MKKLLLLLACGFLFSMQIAFAQEDYPINLMKNQKWQIEVIAEKNYDAINEKYKGIFEVTRDGEELSVIAYDIDLKTGEKIKSENDYYARFIKKYTEPKDDYLEWSYCYYVYENIREGLTCNYFRIPIAIDKKNVQGNIFASSSLMWGDSDELEVIILEKDEKEVECNFRGETYEGKKIYYTKESDEFEELREFACFETTISAEKAGYQLNFAESGKAISEKPIYSDEQNALSLFKDVAENNEYFDAVSYVQEHKIVNGYPDGSFRTDVPINRAEFTKIIMEATSDQSEISGNNCFSDVADEWFAKYVCTAQLKGIIGGYPDGTFKPNQNISFVEAAKIIALAFQYQTSADTEVWYRPFVLQLSEKSSIPTSITDVSKEIIRGEMAEIIYRLKAEVQNKDYMQFEDSKLVVKRAVQNSAPEAEEFYEVTQVIDGDTIEVQMGNEEVRVRLIGIDTPEVKHPSKPQECFGQEASARAKELLEGKEVKLEADSSQDDKDRYDRLLRYVLLEDGTNINELMISEGYAKEYTYSTAYKYQKQFQEAEKEAQENERGLWNPDSCEEIEAPLEEPEEETMPEAEQSIEENTDTYGNCGTKTYCTEMNSCSEAKYFLNICGLDRLDADDDGIPCESLCQ